MSRPSNKREARCQRKAKKIIPVNPVASNPVGDPEPGENSQLQQIYRAYASARATDWLKLPAWAREEMDNLLREVIYWMRASGVATDGKEGPRRRLPERIWRPRFLEALRNSCNVRAACQASGVDRATAYNARNASPEFAAEWDRAIEDSVDTLEAAAYKRATVGTTRTEPIVSAGKIIASRTITEYSDRMAELLLGAHRPLKFNRKLEILMTDKRERAEGAIRQFLQDETAAGRVTTREEAIAFLSETIPDIAQLVR